MTTRPLPAALLLGLLLTVPGAGAAQTPVSATDHAVALRLANAPAEALAYDPSETGLNWADAAVCSLYHEDAPHAFGFRDTQLTKHGAAIVTALREASGHGLDCPSRETLSEGSHVSASWAADRPRGPVALP